MGGHPVVIIIIVISPVLPPTNSTQNVDPGPSFNPQFDAVFLAEVWQQLHYHRVDGCRHGFACVHEYSLIHPLATTFGFVVGASAGEGPTYISKGFEMTAS